MFGIYNSFLLHILPYFLVTSHLDVLSMLKKEIICVPTLETQNHIVSVLDRFDKLCNDISEGLPAEIEARQKQYEYYRDKLLTFSKKSED